VNYWLERGAERSKLVLGVPLYGRSFRLSQPRNTNLGAPSSGAGAAGQFSQEAGMLMYNEVILFIFNESFGNNNFVVDLPAAAQRDGLDGAVERRAAGAVHLQGVPVGRLRERQVRRHQGKWSEKIHNNLIEMSCLRRASSRSSSNLAA
jgi:hypothetical protein